MASPRITLSPDLEACVLHALSQGLAPPDAVKPEELSKEGRWLLQAIQNLRSSSSQGPLALSSVWSCAIDVLGADAKAIRPLMKRIKRAGSGAEVADIVQAVRDKQLLVEIINAAGEQLSGGRLDTAILAGLLVGNRGAAALDAAAALVRDGIPSEPSGVPLKSLPQITKASGGVFGTWIIGGEPGLGKSTFAWQVALEVGRVQPVIYFDLDDTGTGTLLRRTWELCKRDNEATRRALQRVYLRDHIRTLEADLGAVPAPALVVVDSLQTLPTAVQHRRTSLDGWITRLKSLTKRGYAVLMISEKARASYGEVWIGAFKETGAAEYAASFGGFLAGEEDQDPDEPIRLVVVKNRHRKAKGLITYLERDPEKVWWFTETSGQREEEAVD